MSDTKTNWSLLVPIYNLEISPDLGGKLIIDDVTFVSSDRIPGMEKSLGLPYPVSYYQANLERPVFKMAQVYACIKTRRSSDDLLPREFHRIQEAVYLLASSQFHRAPRGRFHFGGPSATSQLDEYYIIENKGQGGTNNSQRTFPIEPYRLNKEWELYLKRHFFFDLIKILNNKKRIDNWKYIIRQAAILAGQSQVATKIWESFLYNMIAIESLLLDKKDRKTEKEITDILVALFGWLEGENIKAWEDKCRRLYDLRNKFVHDGDISGITLKDVLDTDEILGNLLRNICKFTEYFTSKKTITDLSEKLAARRLLGEKPVERPKGFIYSRRTSSESELKEFERTRLWWQ